MNNPLLNKTDNNLDIYISEEGISCIVSDENQNVMIHQELNVSIHHKTDIHLIEAFFSQPELDVLSDNITIHVENSFYLLIPSELYRNEDIGLFFQTIFGKGGNETLQNMAIPKWSLHLTYRMPEKLITFFIDRFPEVEFEHIIFSLLKGFIQKHQQAVYLNIRKNEIDLGLTQNNKLQLLVSFPVKTNEDICYYVLNVFEQFHLNTERVALKIKQKNGENNPVVKLLKQYITNVIKD